jgi:putative lipoic acid-binding regulatory protein
MNLPPDCALLPGTGFSFPGEFEIAAMGRADRGLEARVPGLLRGEAGLRVIEDSLSARPSSGGQYVAVRVRFVAASRDDYMRAHAVLRADPDIRYTL